VAVPAVAAQEKIHQQVTLEFQEQLVPAVAEAAAETSVVFTAKAEMAAQVLLRYVS
jgi:hypothetical protein